MSQPPRDRRTNTCPDCEGTGIAFGSWAKWDAGAYHRDGRMMNVAICHCLTSGSRGEGDALPDSVDHPPHYGAVPGIECIDVVEHFSFNTGNAIKYIWRHRQKGKPIEDLRKALWYIEREIAGLEAAASPPIDNGAQR